MNTLYTIVKKDWNDIYLGLHGDNIIIMSLGLAYISIVRRKDTPITLGYIMENKSKEII